MEYTNIKIHLNCFTCICIYSSDIYILPSWDKLTTSRFSVSPRIWLKRLKACFPCTMKNSTKKRYSRHALSTRAYCSLRNNASKGYCNKKCNTKWNYNTTQNIQIQLLCFTAFYQAVLYSFFQLCTLHIFMQWQTPCTQFYVWHEPQWCKVPDAHAVYLYMQLHSPCVQFYVQHEVQWWELPTAHSAHLHGCQL